MNPKLPSQLTIEELLSSVTSQSSTNLIEQPVSFKDPFMSFILAYNIKPGNSRISGEVLYRLFKSWDKTSEFKVQGFNKQMCKLLPNKQVKNKTTYLVENNLLELVQKTEANYKAPKSDRTKTRAWHTHYEKFLADNKLSEGSVWLETDIFFYIYNRWCDSFKRNVRFSYTNFIAVCKLNFTLKKIKHSPHYWVGLNEEVKNMITNEEVERWRQGRIRINGTRSKAKKAP